MTIVKRALLKCPDGRQQEFFLFRVEPAVFRFADANGRLWDGVDYLSENVALKAIRVSCDTDPAMVGVDLTIYPVELPPDERAATRIVSETTGPIPAMNDDPALAAVIANVSRIIREETNITEIVEAVNTLLAFIVTRRDAYARAMFPVHGGRAPRDLTLDGLLLAAIEALGKATKQDYANIITALKEPVSSLQIAHNMPIPKGPVQ
jgi:hypothetical protein